MAATPIRTEYSRASLCESEVETDPIRQFHAWFDEVLAAGLPEPNAMTLATATPEGKPSARIVLLKEFDERGFTFHTSYQGRKAREIEANPQAALVLFWPALERQVRIEGRVERVSEAESDAYFRTRPTGARLGAWASQQSEAIAGRDVLEAKLREAEARFGGGPIPRPAHWGGYRLVPDSVEFWQGRPNRLHDRIVYRRAEEGGWSIVRLSP